MHRARRPLVLSHRDSDADSLGSALALGGAFAQLGVEAVLAVHQPERIAPPLNELPGATGVVPLSADLISADHDVTFVVDTDDYTEVEDGNDYARLHGFAHA